MLLLLTILTGAVATIAQEPAPSLTKWIEQALVEVCPANDLDGIEIQSRLPGSWLIEETRRPQTGPPHQVLIRLTLPSNNELVIERRFANGQQRQFRASLFKRDGEELRAQLLAIADGGCNVQSGRRIRTGQDGWMFLDQLDGDLSTLRWSETLQAPWPAGKDPGGIRVAMIDSGLAYDLEIFRDRLARNPDGAPIGYDFWDMDPWPYDGDVARSRFLPIRHGTAVASVLIREAPQTALIPYRYPRPDMSRLAKAVESAAKAGARIIAMPLGSRRRTDWIEFEAALDAHQLLAIVSAGNDGQDIDATPVWPSSSNNANIIVVTSADGFGRLAKGSNWGAESVDIMLPAENIKIIDFRGAQGTGSGSSYAVPRLAALAARILQDDPSLSITDLKARILARAIPSPFEKTPVVKAGWIPDPLKD